MIPCFNHGEFLPEAVASVTSLRRDDVELIVVDDGSTDEGTRKEMDELTAQGIKVLRQQNRGLAAARNAGILASQGQYILPLDADNRLRPAYIDHAVRILEADPQVGVVYGDAEYFGACAGRWNVGPFDLNKLLHWNYIDACAVHRRVIWEQNSGYDGSMPAQGFEDWDFWLGALEHGWQFAYVPEILFDYRVARQSMTTRAKCFVPQIAKFVGAKHGVLYREAYVQLAQEHSSVRLTARNLGRLLKCELRQNFQRNRKQSQLSCAFVRET